MKLRSQFAILAAVAVAAGGLLTAAQALQPNGSGHGPRAAAGTSLSLPPIPSGPGWTALGLVIDHSVQNVKRAKLSFNVDPFRGFSWLQALPEPPDDNGVFWDDAKAEIYVTDPGKVDSFGEFAPVTVHTLAFGTIPVSATVHISQIRKDGQIVPFEVKFRFSTSPTPPPTPLPCSPPATRTLQCRYTESPKLSGLVDVRVDNLKIDKVPVDVGSDCHTGTPATMSLSAPAGYYSFSPLYLPPGLYFPFLGGTLHGPVDVPAFVGCHNGADDLNPVLTAMVAGPDNQLAAHQDGSLQPYPPPAPKK